MGKSGKFWDHRFLRGSFIYRFVSFAKLVGVVFSSHNLAHFYTLTQLLSDISLSLSLFLVNSQVEFDLVWCLARMWLLLQKQLIHTKSNLTCITYWISFGHCFKNQPKQTYLTSWTAAATTSSLEMNIVFPFDSVGKNSTHIQVIFRICSALQVEATLQSLVFSIANKPTCIKQSCLALLYLEESFVNNLLRK